MKPCEFHVQNGVEFVTFPVLSALPWLIHGFSTRKGGVSAMPYATLNLGLHVGDDPEAVIENRRRFADALGADLHRWVVADQVHDKQVALVTEQEMGRGARDINTSLPATDGLITATPGVFLTAYFADCVPVFLVDTEQQAIGLAHAGWKGTVEQTAAETLRKMQQAFSTKPSQTLAVIGPSIGSCCYEVDDRVYIHIKTKLGCFLPEILIPQGGGKWKLNLWQANRLSLLAAGIPPENITVSGLCTSCDTDRFYSHRAEGGRTGRMAAVIGIRES